MKLISDSQLKYLNIRYAKFFDLTGTFNVPLDAYEPLIQIDNYKFNHSKDYKSEIMEVKLSDVVGSTHPSYYNKKDWLTFFNHLKRTDSPSEVIRYADYLKSGNYNEGPDECTLIAFEGKYWIGKGNHRICTAKLLGMEKIAARVSFYK